MQAFSCLLARLQSAVMNSSSRRFKQLMVRCFKALPCVRCRWLPLRDEQFITHDTAPRPLR